MPRPARVTVAEYASRIVHPLVRVLDDPSPVTAPPELKSASLDALCFVLRQLREDFVIFVPLVRKASRRCADTVPRVTVVHTAMVVPTHSLVATCRTHVTGVRCLVCGDGAGYGPPPPHPLRVRPAGGAAAEGRVVARGPVGAPPWGCFRPWCQPRQPVP